MLSILTTAPTTANLDTALDGDATGLLHLLGPRNMSVRRGGSVRLHCRLVNATTTAKAPMSSNPIHRFVPWKLLAGQQRISVQWNIDGFGFTNESLVERFGHRYSLAGPFNDGVFDLFVHKVRSSDQTSFSCQVTVLTFRLLQAPLVTTLTSSAVYINMHSPPEKLSLKRMPLQTTLKRSQDGNINLQSDNPSMADSTNHIFQDSKTPSSLSTHSAIHRLQHATAMTPSAEIAFQQSGEVWALEGQQVVIECIASPSLPASRLMWMLSSIAEGEDDLGLLQPSFDLEDFVERRQNPLFVHHYPRKRFLFDPREGRALGYRIEDEESTDSASDLLVGSSIITLRMVRSLSGRRLECLVQNAAAFERTVLPQVATTLQVLYVRNMSITTNSSNGDIHFRENQTVSFHCAAEANPSTLKYLWTLKESSLAPLDKLSLKEDEEKEEEEEDLSRLHLGPLERQVGISSILDLRMTAQLHRHVLHCWVSPSAVIAGISLNVDVPTWKRKALLLSVGYGPQMIGPQEEAEAVLMGQSAQLTCQVDANPPARVSWYHYRGIRIVNEASLLANPNATGLFTTTIITRPLLQSFLIADLNLRDFKNFPSEERYSPLHVHTLSMDNFGIYVCVGKAAQKEVRRVVALAESGPPQIDSPIRVSSRVGERSRIACHTIALPRPKSHEFNWFHASANATVIPSSSLYIEYEERLAGSSSILVFPQTSKEHFGRYNCTVVTPLGTDSTVIVLTEFQEMSYVLIFGVGIAIAVALFCLAVLLCYARRRVLLRIGGKTDRFIAVNHNVSRQSIDIHYEEGSIRGAGFGSNVRTTFSTDVNHTQRSPQSYRQYASPLDSTNYLISFDDKASNNGIAAVHRLPHIRASPPFRPTDVYIVTPAEDVLSAETKIDSRLALFFNGQANLPDTFLST